MNVRYNPFTEDNEYFIDGEWVPFDEIDNDIDEDEDEEFINPFKMIRNKTKNKKKKIIDINTMRNTYSTYFNDDGEFMHVWLAKDIKDKIPLYYDGNFLYRYDHGVYRNDGFEYIRKYAQKLLGDKSKRSRIEETLYWLQNDTYISHDELELDDTYINVKNGLLNWRTGELKQHTSEYKSTIQLPVVYDPNANETIIKEFIKSVVPSDTIKTVFEMIGYCLIPSTRYEKAFMLTGTGANGKSTFINMLIALIGNDNVSNIPLQDLENNRFKVAQLQNKLLNTFADLPNITMEKSSIFKSVVSGDYISAEFKNKDSFDFKPFAKLIFSTNEIPGSRDTTDGYFRRWIIIPFNNKFSSQNADPKLIDKLTTEKALSTLLNYAINGLKRLEKNGHFTESETINKMLEQYKKDADNVASFIEEMCILDDEEKCPTRNLYEEYRNWCIDSGLKPLGKIKFNKRIEEKYNLHKKSIKIDNSTKEYWLGINIDNIIFD